MTNAEVEALTLDKYFVSNLNLAYTFQTPKSGERSNYGCDRLQPLQRRIREQRLGIQFLRQGCESQNRLCRIRCASGYKRYGPCLFPLLTIIIQTDKTEAANMERGFLFPHFLFHIFGRKHPKLCNELLTEGNHRIIPYHFRHFCQTAISPAHDNRGSFYSSVLHESPL